MAALYDHPSGGGSPANLWPADRTWLTFSDWDLCGTRVAGPPALVAVVEADELFETLRLPDVDAAQLQRWRGKRAAR